jgi:hypothetical protein
MITLREFDVMDKLSDSDEQIENMKDKVNAEKKL